MNPMLKAAVPAGPIAICEPSAAPGQTPANDPQPIEILPSNVAFAPTELQLRQGHPIAYTSSAAAPAGTTDRRPSSSPPGSIRPKLPRSPRAGSSSPGRGPRGEPDAGSYKEKCTHFMHSAFGNEGEEHRRLTASGASPSEGGYPR